MSLCEECQEFERGTRPASLDMTALETHIPLNQEQFIASQVKGITLSYSKNLKEDYMI